MPPEAHDKARDIDPASARIKSRLATPYLFRRDQNLSSAEMSTARFIVSVTTGNKIIFLEKRSGTAFKLDATCSNTLREIKALRDGSVEIAKTFSFSWDFACQVEQQHQPPHPERLHFGFRLSASLWRSRSWRWRLFWGQARQGSDHIWVGFGGLQKLGYKALVPRD